MVLDMIKHIVKNPVRKCTALRACEVFLRIAIVVDRPHGEKTGQTFADKHRCGMPTKRCNIENSPDQNQPQKRAEDFESDPAAFGW